MTKVDYLNKIIEQVDNLSYREIVRYFFELGLQNISAYPIRKGTKIFRARPIKRKYFDTVDSFKYNLWPKTFGRANSPCFPMFYGTISTNASDEYPVITNYAELNEIIRDLSSKYGEQRIAIGEFTVLNDFNIAALTFHKEFLKINIQFLPLYEQFKTHSETNNLEDIKILEIFSDLFSRRVNSTGLDYRITSAFVEAILEINENLGGIIYPSVRVGGEGINIALRPSCVDKFLKLNRTLISKIYLQDKNVVEDRLKISNIIESNGNIKYKKLNNLGKEKCLELLDKMKK